MCLPNPVTVKGGRVWAWDPPGTNGKWAALRHTAICVAAWPFVLTLGLLNLASRTVWEEHPDYRRPSRCHSQGLCSHENVHL